jgi:3-dehydroquinate synthetase
MTTAVQPARYDSAPRGRALIIERQPLGVWSATVVDTSIGAAIQRFTLEGGPGRETTGNELCAIAQSLADSLGPVDAVIFLAEDAGAAGKFEPTLVAGYPLPVWIVHPSIAIASMVPPHHSRFMVLDFSGGGSAVMLKRGSGVAIEDLTECNSDLRSLLSRRPHRQVVHTDLLADIVGSYSHEASTAVVGSAEPCPEPTPLRLESIFSELLRDFEPMLGILQSFGYGAVVCVSRVFTSETMATAFKNATARIAVRRLPFILSTGEERYKGALNTVGAARQSPGVWSAGTIDRPAFSLVTERRVSYEVQNVPRRIFNIDDLTLATLLGGRPTLAVVDKTVGDFYGRALSAYAARHINLAGVLAFDANEVAKSWSLVERVCDEALRRGIGREGIIMAVGGGITLDVAGMAASLFRRGIRYVRVPTTLVGMIDAGVGIKQGVNFASKKNLLGSFYPPLGCVNDSSFLRTLPRRHLACGVAEMIKIALICDQTLFEILESNIVDFIESHFQEPLATADESILRAQLSMMQQLQPNLFEHDLQRWVDFGHTFSPNLELASHYELAHGEAVALDMALATAIAVERGICDISVLERMVSVYRAAQLPAHSALCSSDVLATSLRDARLHRGGNVNFVVPTAVGAGTFLQDVDGRDIDSAARIVANVEPIFAGA